MYTRECEIDGCFFETVGSAFISQADSDLQEHLRDSHTAEEYKAYLVSRGFDPEAAEVTAAEAHLVRGPDELEA